MKGFHKRVFIWYCRCVIFMWYCRYVIFMWYCRYVINFDPMQIKLCSTKTFMKLLHSVLLIVAVHVISSVFSCRITLIIIQKILWLYSPLSKLSVLHIHVHIPFTFTDIYTQSHNTYYVLNKLHEYKIGPCRTANKITIIKHKHVAII